MLLWGGYYKINKLQKVELTMAICGYAKCSIDEDINRQKKGT